MDILCVLCRKDSDGIYVDPAGAEYLKESFCGRGGKHGSERTKFKHLQ